MIIDPNNYISVPLSLCSFDTSNLLGEDTLHIFGSSVCFATLSNHSFSVRQPLLPARRWSPMATTALVDTETGTPGNHSICFARRITTDPLKMHLTRQRQRDRKERAAGKKNKQETLACCQGNSKAALLETSRCDWLTERGTELW